MFPSDQGSTTHVHQIFQLGCVKCTSLARDLDWVMTKLPTNLRTAIVKNDQSIGKIPELRFSIVTSSSLLNTDSAYLLKETYLTLEFTGKP